MKEGSRTAPLVMLSFDAGDPDLLRRWAEAGHLPTVASIMERGCWTKTKGAELALEHGVWQSIFSGLSRGQHGCYYLRRLKPGSYDLEIVHGGNIDAPPFWAGWRDGKRRVLTVDIHDVPPVPGVAGFQINNWGIHRGWFSRVPAEQPRSEPPELLEQVTQRFGPPLQIIETPNAKPDRNRQILRDLLRRIEKKGMLCRYLLEREQPEVVAISFGDSHTAGHQFWDYRAEGSSNSQVSDNEFAHAIRQVYQTIDQEMGRLIEQLPSDSNIFILSSVGLADHYPTGELLTAFCRELGYEVPADSHPVSLHPLAIARRIVPEKIRVALSRYLSRETRERLLAEQFRNRMNWRKTTAFALPCPYTGFLRVNLRGREPEGIVEPGSEYEALLQRLETDLSQLIDPQTGEPAIDHIVRAGEVYGSNPPDALPDLIVHWKSCRHFVDRVIHPKVELTQQKPEFFRSTDHREQGFIAAAGPNIEKAGEIEQVDVLDLAPTFLALLNEPKPQEMTGTTISEIIVPASDDRC